MIREAITKLAAKENLTYEEAETVMNEIMSGEGQPGADERLSDCFKPERGRPLMR